MLSVLVIEDDPINLELVTDLLEMTYQVFGVDCAEVGIELALSLKPHLIIMDIGLPGMDGISAMQVLKSNRTTQNIPIIILSAHAMPSDEIAARDAGCSGYMIKPINTRNFVHQIEWLFSRVDRLPEAA